MNYQLSLCVLRSFRLCFRPSNFRTNMFILVTDVAEYYLRRFRERTEARATV